ncbi:MAG: hypothetical protein AAF405_09205 [Pseudomonadota bacterium]
MRTLLMLAALVLASILTLVAPPLHAEPTPLEGSWSGSGTMQPVDRPTQKLTCRVNYQRETDKVFKFSAKCVTVSTAINQTGELLNVNPGVYVGEFNIASYDVSGRVRVVIADGVQTMTFKSTRASGSLTLTKS